MLFWCEKTVPETSFSDFRILFGVIWEIFLEHFGSTLAAFFLVAFRSRFGVTFGSILESFWGHFGVIVGVLSDVFLLT